MSELPIIYLPTILVNMAKVEVYDNPNNRAFITALILKEKALRLFLENAIEDIRRGMTYDEFLKKIGILSFRNIVASFYAYKIKNNKFPKTMALDAIDVILKTEGLIQNASHRNDPHVFLLAFYLFQLKEKGIDLTKNIEGVIKKISKTTNQTDDYDYFCLSLFKFAELLDEDIFMDNEEYEVLYSYLNPIEKENFIQTLYSYSLARQDQEFLTEERI